jgi:hypothetical protein
LITIWCQQAISPEAGLFQSRAAQMQYDLSPSKMGVDKSIIDAEEGHMEYTVPARMSKPLQKAVS